MRRARLIGAACNKLPALHQVLATLPETPTKAIFYCGDGRTTDAIAADEIRQIQAVAPSPGRAAWPAGARFHLPKDAEGARCYPPASTQRMPRCSAGSESDP